MAGDTENFASHVSVGGNLNVGGTAYARTAVPVVASTAAATVAKFATLTGYSLEPGHLLAVTFTLGNTATAPTLNINGTGAKPIRQNGANLTTANRTIGAGATLLLYYDGVAFHLQGQQQEGPNVPSGALTAFAGSAAPTGWLLCAGQAVSRSTYADLFDTIGTTYGSGNGLTTFNVPDLRGRVPAGLDNLNGTDAGRLSLPNILGTTTGAQTHVLTQGQMPSHTHTQVQHTHYNVGRLAVGSGYLVDPGNTAAGPGQVGIRDGVTEAASATTALNNNTGSGLAHNNMQPTILLSYIIKT